VADTATIEYQLSTEPKLKHFVGAILEKEWFTVGSNNGQFSPIRRYRLI
jgi:hypothetical protein